MANQKKKKDFSSYTYGEARTGGGQLIEFTCKGEDVEKVKSFLAENVKGIDIPVTGQVSTSHGSFEKYSRYKVVQHKYAGGGYGPSCGGYIEVLEIKNPPMGRHRIVIYEFLNGYGVFTEWKTLSYAKVAFEKGWCSSKTDEEFKKTPGFIRRVECGLLQPWFYAIGDEELVGDFAFPEGLQDDPVYRFGQKFVVTDYEGYSEVKTCMGVRFVSKVSEERGQWRDETYEPETTRLICWDDGTITRDSCHRCNSNNPRLLEEGEIWITDALAQFRKMLTGKTERFKIDFTNGYKFIGRVLKNGNKAKCPQGRYSLRVYFKGQKKPDEGWVDFMPTPESPDVVIHIEQDAKVKRPDKEIERIEVVEKQVEKGGKKWVGAFHKSPY